MQLKDVIEQRKTIKRFDPTVKIPRTELEEIFTLALQAPSKANLQPWRFVVVDDEAQKSRLLGSVAHNVPPCETAPVLVLVLADLAYEKLLGDILDYSVKKGCLGAGFRQNAFNFLLSVHQAASPAEIRDQVLIDTSLAAMQLMLAIKDKGYDSHAIGIFNRQAVLELLEVDAERYAPVMLLAVGKAATDPVPSVRLPLEYTLSWNNGKGFKK